MRRHRARFVPLTAASAVTALAVAACGTTSASSTGSTSSAKPITVGISLPLTGSFAADGLATENGYKLWASDVNTHGGLLGRPVRLVLRNDNSDPNTVSKDYNVLITKDHVNLTLAPFSTLLSINAMDTTAKYGYALPAGAATGTAMFIRPHRNLFSVSVPVAKDMLAFSDWVTKKLPVGQRLSAAYPEVNNPFSDPPVDTTESILHAAGVKTVYWNHNALATTPAQIKKAATTVAQKNPQIVVVGSVDLPSLLIFVHTWQSMHYTPRIMIAASGPDQGQAFLNTLNPSNAEAIMVPNAWYGGVQNALSHVMVQNYIAKFGGTSSDINADVAEAYAAGEVLADAVGATKSVNNTKIINYLHSGVTLQTVQGPVSFNKAGENLAAGKSAFIFQWQNGQFIPVLPSNQFPNKVEAMKPGWQ